MGAIRLITGERASFLFLFISSQSVLTRSVSGSSGVGQGGWVREEGEKAYFGNDVETIDNSSTCCV